MKGYWLTLCHVTDSELYNKYIKLAGPAIEKYGGKFLARGGQQTKLEGESFERTVLIEFPSIDAAEEAYHSEEYKEALEFSSKSSVRHVVIVEGL